MILRILFLLFFALPLFGVAQTFSYRHFSVEDGLPSSQVYDALQDDQGLMWFGTDRGVVRFDGYEFEVFTMDDGLLDNVILHLYKDRLGRIWFASFSGDLCYFEAGKIVPYEYNHVIHENVGFPLIMSFSVDKSGGIHLALWGSGYLSLDNGGDYSWDKGIDRQYHIVELEDDYLMYNTNPKRQYFLEDPLKLRYIDSDKKEHDYEIPFSRSENQKGVMKGAFSFEGAIYFSIENQLYKLDEGELSLIYTVSEQINKIFVSDGLMWLGTYNAGFIIFDPNQPEPSPNVYLEGHTICDFFKDSEGAVWVTTLNNGIYYIPNRRHYSFTQESGFPVKDVFSMASSGEHLLVMDSKGESCWIDLKKDSIIPTTEYTKRFDRPRQIVYSSEFESFFFRNTYETIRVVPGEEHISYDCSGRIWIKEDTILYLSSLPRSQPYEDKGVQIAQLPVGEHLQELGVRLLYLDQNRIYMGGLSGIQEIIRRPDSMEDSVIFLKERDPIFGTRIVQMTALEGHDFIAATRGEGLLMVKDGVPSTVKKENGLLSNQLTCLFVDEDQSIWAGSSKGISVINKDGGVINLGQGDGLISNEITAIWGNDRKIYVGTKKGLTILDREQIFDCKGSIPVVFKSIELENEKLLVTDQNRVQIQYNEPYLAIEFAGVSYKSRGQIRYKYRLRENESWQYTRINRLLLNNLAPGEYRLEIYASTGEDGWGENPAVLEISVAFPFWQTLWFKTLIFLVFCVVLVLIYRFALQRVKRRERIERQIQNLRFEALSAQMNPHFIFNSLNSIQNFIIKNEKKSSVQYLSKFAKLMRKTLDHSQQKNITLNTELEALNLYLELEVLRFGNQIHYDITVDKMIQTEKVILPALLIQPIVENAILHGLRPKEGPGLIRLKFSKVGNQLVIRIEDNGVGRNGLKDNTDHESKGGTLTEERVALFSASFDEPYEYNIVDLVEHNKATGTQVNIRIPYMLKPIT